MLTTSSIIVWPQSTKKPTALILEQTPYVAEGN